MLSLSRKSRLIEVPCHISLARTELQTTRAKMLIFTQDHKDFGSRQIMRQGYFKQGELGNCGFRELGLGFCVTCPYFSVSLKNLIK